MSIITPIVIWTFAFIIFTVKVKAQAGSGINNPNQVFISRPSWRYPNIVAYNIGRADALTSQEVFLLPHAIK